MNYNKLFYFYTVTNFMNISRAAEHLCISQPSLSKAISDLEDELGTKLFKRHPKTLEITESGIILLDYCVDFFESENAVIDRINALSPDNKRLIRFEYMHLKYTYRLNAFFNEFQKAHPNYEIVGKAVLEEDNIDAGLHKKRSDISLRIIREGELPPDFDYVLIERQPLAVIMPDTSPFAGKDVITQEDLTQMRIIPLFPNNDPSAPSDPESWSRNFDFMPKMRPGHNRAENVLSMVQAGLGVALLSEFAPVHFFTGLKTVPLENSDIFYSGLFWRKSDLSEQARAFRDAFVREFKTL